MSPMNPFTGDEPPMMEIHNPFTGVRMLVETSVGEKVNELYKLQKEYTTLRRAQMHSGAVCLRS